MPISIQVIFTHKQRKSNKKKEKSHFQEEYLNKLHILICILKHLNSDKIFGAKIRTQNVLKRQILTNSIALSSELNVGASIKFEITELTIMLSLCFHLNF